MTKVSEKDKENFQKNKEVINIKEFMLLKSGKQDELIEETLNKVYEEKIEINKKYIDKVLNVAFDNKDNEAYLPHSLCVQKDGNKLVFSFKKNNKALVILFLLGFLFISGFATFTGIQLIGSAKMNIDLDGDGIADLNLDLNADGLCEVNCTNNGKTPEYNIDHGTMRTPLFNVKMKDDEKGEYIFNPMNQMDEYGTCKLNCDTNEDGWPEINIDLDGDGVADINIDVDKDGSPDLNIDTNGDGVADINIDEDNDNVCDKNCSYTVTRSGQATSGDGTISADVAALVVTFEAGSDVKVDNLYPDDQPDEGVITKVNDVKFTIENKTSEPLKYSLSWKDVENTFETNNFWTKIVSTNNGYNKDWSAAPKTSTVIMESVEIPAKTIQEYTVSFTLHGTGEEQNIDQGKVFKGKVQVNLLDE